MRNAAQRRLWRGPFRTGGPRDQEGGTTGYQLVQDVFRLYADAVPDTPGAVADPEKLQRYYKARDTLQLELIDPDGKIVPGTTVHVYERAGNDDALELEVHIADSAFWRAIAGHREEQ